MRTDVMTLGNLGAVDAEGNYVYPPVPAGGMPGYGGPDSTYAYGSVEPTWQVNRMPMPPDTPGQPQNLLRPTDKTLSAKMSSVGSPVASYYFLSGLNGLGGHGDPQQQPQQRDTLMLRYGWMAVSYGILGSVTAAVQLSSRKASTGGVVLGAIGGFLMPLLVNGGILLWPKR
jgi:hypothetical protein